MKLIATSIVLALTFTTLSHALQDDPTEAPAAPPAESDSSASADDAELKAIPAPMRAQVQKMLDQLAQATNPDDLRKGLEALQAQSEQMPPQMKPMMDYMMKKMQARIDQLESGDGKAAAKTSSSESAPPSDAASKTTTDAAPAADTSAATSATNDASAAAQKAMEDFLYGVLAGRKELALTNVKFLLESNTTNSQLAQMIDGANLQERFNRALRATKGMGEVSDLASQLEVRVSKGRLELSRDPARIDQAVRQLGGTMRQQTMAKASLMAAGAYAVPALFKALLDSSNAQLELRASQTLIDIGRASVLPLCEVLPTAAPREQVAICNMLTAINSKLAAPWLAKTLRLATASDVKNAADTALRALKVSNVTELILWTTLARDYFVSRDALTPYPEESTQVIWSVDSTGSISPKLVPTAVYGDLMAQRCALEAMRLDPSAPDALSIYLAAGLRSEALAKSEGSMSMMGIALAAGSEQAQSVLRLARQVNDPGLTLMAIDIMSKTASESMLVDSKSGSPILACLNNPSRTIRTHAALAIAHAQPQKTFQGSERVIPILGAAVVQGSTARVIIISSDETQRRQMEGRLSQIGCSMLSSDASASAVLSALSGRGAPDMIIACGGANEMTSALTVLRANPALFSTPILFAIPEADEVRLDRSIRQDPSVVIWFQGKSDAQFQSAAKQLMDRTIGAQISGPQSAADSQSLQMETLRVLREIGQMPASPLQLADAERDFIDALTSNTGEVQILVANVLSVTPTVSAQRALINAALSASDAQQVALLDALSQSGRRYGNQAEEKQIDRLRSALMEAKDANATAMAEAYGALNVGTAQVLKLILK